LRSPQTLLLRLLFDLRPRREIVFEKICFRLAVALTKAWTPFVVLFFVNQFSAADVLSSTGEGRDEMWVDEKESALARERNARKSVH